MLSVVRCVHFQNCRFPSTVAAVCVPSRSDVSWGFFYVCTIEPFCQFHRHFRCVPYSMYACPYCAPSFHLICLNFYHLFSPLYTWSALVISFLPIWLLCYPRFHSTCAIAIFSRSALQSHPEPFVLSPVSISRFCRVFCEATFVTPFLALRSGYILVLNVAAARKRPNPEHIGSNEPNGEQIQWRKGATTKKWSHKVIAWI